MCASASASASTSACASEHSGHEVISFQVGGASEAGIEMGRHDAQSPERKVREARIQPRLRMTRQKAPAQPRSAASRRPTGAQGAQYRQAEDGPAGRRRPADTRSSDARPSFSRFAVWVARRETKISGEPSTVCGDVNQRSERVAGIAVDGSHNAPARVARSRALAMATASKSAAGAFSGRRPGMKPGKAA